MSQALTQEEIDRALRAADTSGIFGPLPGVTFYPHKPTQASQVTLRPHRRRSPMGPKITVALVWLFAAAGLMALRYWPSKLPIRAATVCNPNFDANCRR